jgi:hypothetical protein
MQLKTLMGSGLRPCRRASTRRGTRTGCQSCFASNLTHPAPPPYCDSGYRSRGGATAQRVSDPCNAPNRCSAGSMRSPSPFRFRANKVNRLASFRKLSWHAPLPPVYYPAFSLYSLISCLRRVQAGVPLVGSYMTWTDTIVERLSRDIPQTRSVVWENRTTV